MIETLQLGLVNAPAAAPAAGGGGFDLTTVLASFGASVPLFLWLLKMHRDLITVVIPRGFRLIRREMRRQGDSSKERHGEHIELMRAMQKALATHGNGKAAIRKSKGRGAAQAAAKRRTKGRPRRKPAK